MRNLVTTSTNFRDRYLNWLSAQLTKVRNCVKSGDQYQLEGGDWSYFITKAQKRKITEIAKSAPEQLCAWIEAEISNIKERAGSEKEPFKKKYNPLGLGFEKAKADALRGEWIKHWKDARNSAPSRLNDLIGEESAAKTEVCNLKLNFPLKGSAANKDAECRSAAELHDLDKLPRQHDDWSKLDDEYRSVISNVAKMETTSREVFAAFITSNVAEEKLKAGRKKKISTPLESRPEKIKATDENEKLPVVDWEEPDTLGGRTRKMVKYEYRDDEFLPWETVGEELGDGEEFCAGLYQTNDNEHNQPYFKQEFPRHKGDGCLTDEEK